MRAPRDMTNLTAHERNPGAPFGWVIVGPGKIAHRFADAVMRMPHAKLIGVTGRDALRAADFATTWMRDGIAPTVYANIDASIADPAVDGVYIATPHAFHFAAAQHCLTLGKPVLCEKPLAVNAAQAQALVRLSEERQVFLMEAVWTRFLPIYDVVRAWLSSNEIGPVRAIHSSFCFDVPFDPAHRIYDPAQAGGALLDLGIYNLTITRWALAAAFGACPLLEKMYASGVIAPSGVDQRVSGLLVFANGVTSSFVCGVDGAADNSFRIFGQHGTIEVVANFWEATRATLHRPGQPAINESRPFAINGFEGEIDEAMRCIDIGAIESARMPHAETIATLSWMDQIRVQLGVRYPFEV